MDGLPFGDMKGLGRNALAQAIVVLVLLVVGVFCPQVASVGLLFIIGVYFTLINATLYATSVANQGEGMSLSGFIIAGGALTGETMLILMLMGAILAAFL